MNLLHLLDEPWDSGVTAYALQIAELLHKHGERVVVGVRPGKAPERLAQARGLATAPFRSALDLRALLRREAWDVVNAHTGNAHTWSVLLTWRRPAARRPAVIRTRGDARAVAGNALARFLYRRTAGVIAASEHIRRQYEEELGLGDDRLETVYPSVEADETPSPFPQNRVGILGRLDEVKGHAVLLEAAARVLRSKPGVVFRIAGKEAGITIPVLRNQASQLGIEPAIEFLGYQPSATAFMRGCTIGVIASVGSEEISRACLEWMAVGRPVVGTLVGSVPELVEPRETGLLVPPGDGAAMAEALLSLLDDPATAERWGKNANALVKRRFGAPLQLERTLALYRRVRER